MRKLVLFMHISLDGFSTDAKGSIDWINIDQEMFDYAGERTRNADTALYGGGTFRIMEDYWPTAADKPNPTRHDIEHSAWYNQVEKIVVSKSWKGGDQAKTRIINKDAIAEIAKLKKENGKEIIMFGSPTLAHSLMDENLINDYWIFINPVLLGQGLSLFPGLRNMIKLKLLFSKTFASGVVCLHYESIENQ